MCNKPDKKNFILTSLFNTKWHFVYKNKEKNKLFKEENAFKARFIKEIILFVFLGIVWVIDLLAPTLGFVVSIQNRTMFLLIILGMLPAVLHFLHAFRYEKVKFVEIKNVRDAEDTRIKIIEVLIFIVYFGAMLEVI